MLLAVSAAVLGVALGPWLAAVTLRSAARYRPELAGRPTRCRTVLTSIVAAAALTGVPLSADLRPAQLGLAWAGAAGVVLAGVDLAVHRLPDAVVRPAVAVCAVSFLADAVTAGEWTPLVRGLVAGLACAALATAVRLAHRRGLGGGDVKLLGLLGLVLGWAGLPVLLAGVFLGLLLGAVGALLLMAAGRAGWRTPIAFGPPLLLGAWLALVLAAPLPVA